MEMQNEICRRMKFCDIILSRDVSATLKREQGSAAGIVVTRIGFVEDTVARF